MNKVFVTGADGMLGNSICRELIKQNYVVKAFCLNNKYSHTLNGLGIEIVYGNVLNKETVLFEMRDCDYVIHAAAMTNVWLRRNSLVRNVNIEGTINVMEAAKTHKLKRMVHISSASAFKNGSIEQPGTEKNPYDGWKWGMDYIDSKYMAQNILINEYKKSNFPVIIINPTFMIGPFDSGPSSGKMILGLFTNCIPGYSSGGKNFVCSQDVAVAVTNALNKGREGECYISGNENMTYKDFFKLVSMIMKIKFTLRPVPYWCILMVGAFYSVLGKLSGRIPKISYGMACMANKKLYFSSEKAKKELDLPSTPITFGIEQCIDWFKRNAYIK